MTRSTRARKTDPETSHQAADTQERKLRPSQARILAMFKMYGDMHDKQLVDYVHDAEKMAGFKKLMSQSGVRSRRNELAKANEERLVELRRQWMAVRGFTKIVEGRPFRPAPSGPESAGAFANTVEIAASDEWARRTLRIEGFRSPLWDTGRREVVDDRNVIVWGIAR